jgi:hypothetical protein
MRMTHPIYLKSSHNFKNYNLFANGSWIRTVISFNGPQLHHSLNIHECMLCVRIDMYHITYDPYIKFLVTILEKMKKLKILTY